MKKFIVIGGKKTEVSYEYKVGDIIAVKNESEDYVTCTSKEKADDELLMFFVTGRMLPLFDI